MHDLRAVKPLTDEEFHSLLIDDVFLIRRLKKAEGGLIGEIFGISTYIVTSGSWVEITAILNKKHRRVWGSVKRDELPWKIEVEPKARKAIERLKSIAQEIRIKESMARANRRDNDFFDELNRRFLAKE